MIYEVTSDSIPVVNVEYVDQSGRKLLESAPLPWRLDVSLDDANVQIHSNGELLCRSVIDVGNATCYGNTPYIN